MTKFDMLTDMGRGVFLGQPHTPLHLHMRYAIYQW